MIIRPSDVPERLVTLYRNSSFTGSLEQYTINMYIAYRMSRPSSSPVSLAVWLHGWKGKGEPSKDSEAQSGQSL